MRSDPTRTHSCSKNGNKLVGSADAEYLVLIRREIQQSLWHCIFTFIRHYGSIDTGENRVIRVIMNKHLPTGVAAHDDILTRPGD